MRNTVVFTVIIGLVWIGYMAWPLCELTLLARAIDARDVRTVVRHVNFDRVRTQIASAYVQRSGIQPGLVGQQAVILGLSIADPVITKLVSPEALSELLAVGWPAAVVSEPPPSGTLRISSDTLGTAWQIFAASRYGIGRFEVSAPTAAPPVTRFRLTFHLLAWRWQLTGITLPENIRNLLMDQVIKAVRERR